MSMKKKSDNRANVMAKSSAPIEVQFAQKLAANEPPIRAKAVKKLRSWLAARSKPGCPEFTEEEMLRIWKGIHYCYWMSDKPLVQEELAENVSSLINVFGTKESALLFLQCFLITLGIS